MSETSNDKLSEKALIGFINSVVVRPRPRAASPTGMKLFGRDHEAWGGEGTHRWGTASSAGEKKAWERRATFLAMPAHVRAAAWIWMHCMRSEKRADKKKPLEEAKIWSQIGPSSRCFQD